MSEQQNQEQNASDSGNAQGQDNGGSEESREKYVPRSRFDEVNTKKAEADRRARDAEAKLQQLESEREQQQEERASKQGEYQQLAEKRQKKIDALQTELNQVKAQWTEERRRNTWNEAAQGVIKGNAIKDAFLFLSEDELSALDEGDTEGYKRLAQNLVEVRDYLGAEGARGAGSGGSRVPVAGLASNQNGGANGGQQGSGRQPLFHNPSKRRRLWK